MRAGLAMEFEEEEEKKEEMQVLLPSTLCLWRQVSRSCSVTHVPSAMEWR